MAAFATACASACVGRHRMTPAHRIHTAIVNLFIRRLPNTLTSDHGRRLYYKRGQMYGSVSWGGQNSRERLFWPVSSDDELPAIAQFRQQSDDLQIEPDKRH